MKRETQNGKLESAGDWQASPERRLAAGFTRSKGVDDYDAKKQSHCQFVRLSFHPHAKSDAKQPQIALRNFGGKYQHRNAQWNGNQNGEPLPAMKEIVQGCRYNSDANEVAAEKSGRSKESTNLFPAWTGQNTCDRCEQNRNNQAAYRDCQTNIHRWIKRYG